jgi:hypothetical protein
MKTVRPEDSGYKGMDEAIFRRCSQAVISENDFSTYFMLTAKTVCSQTEHQTRRQANKIN